MLAVDAGTAEQDVEVVGDEVALAAGAFERGEYLDVGQLGELEALTTALSLSPASRNRTGSTT